MKNIPLDEITELIKNLTTEKKIELIEKKKYLDVFIIDEDEFIRCEVAKQGYGLDILVYDKSGFVRCGVIRQGYGLDILINDEDCNVRYEVAKQRYGLNILINDENYDVRQLAKKLYKEEQKNLELEELYEIKER